MTEYLLQIIDEPEEAPILLTQADFDMILDKGVNEPPIPESDSKPFATVTTSPEDSPLLYQGNPISEDLAADLVGRGLNAVLRLVLTGKD